MADITKLNINGNEYNIKDEEAANKVINAVEGNIVKFDADGNLADGGKSVTTIDNLFATRVIGDTNKKYKIVACVIRNNAGTWEFIENSSHSKTGVSSIAINGSDIKITFDFIATKVISFIAAPDEVYVKAGIGFGASVAVDNAIISISTTPKIIGAYISYNGTDWVVSNANGNISVTGFASNILSLSHDSVGSEIIGHVTGRGGNYIPQLGSCGATTSQVTFYKFDGTAETVLNTNMKIFFSRTRKQTTLTPADIELVSSNIWCYGIFEVE